ncbi:hypothetical protein [Psychroserpens algicola]|uniref:hypothetical protein n=1 Tax=Psychroserpens algicola TaxID=1719034 RepID=UPI0019545F8D|nr:hypothetical protein [Psychroserpens algicola]
MKFQRRHLLLNYIFIGCLIVLVLNDHILKWEYSNWLTGKLSDFAGMLILPIIITYCNPKHLKFNLVLSAVLFMFWKSSLSTNAIALYNTYAFIKTSRVVDYTDYIALIMLPIAYYIITKINTNPQYFQIKTRFNSAYIFVLTLFILISETPGRQYYITHTDSNFKCHNCDLKLDMSQAEILEKLKRFNIKADTNYNQINENRYGFSEDSLNYYTIKAFIINQDTLRNADISLRSPVSGKTIISLNGFDYEKPISNQKMKRKLNRHFKKIVKSYFREL